jgi:hypothetical protein
MLFGWVVRFGAFAMNAALIFILTGQTPGPGPWERQAQPSLFEHYRAHILIGLKGTRADLQANGHLLFLPRQAQGVRLPPLNRHRKHPA